eukprot:TRINITY_DN4036_c0_g1_i1.p1 TRINITY_DN4036_c0_g1~~TRINITY_DN4036_c0_g1_i1.p1  ORF type:complete len:152 (+),score=28.23 TRINITY_DN4036_c0_g1_i1:289-744(+)
MLPITAFPARFATAVKRPLKTLAAAHVKPHNRVLSALSSGGDRRATTNFHTANLKYVNGNQRTHPVPTRVGGGELSIRTFASAVPQCDHGRAEPDYEAELAGTKGVLPPTRGMSGDNLYGPRPDLWWTGPTPATVPAPAAGGSRFIRRWPS